MTTSRKNTLILAKEFSSLLKKEQIWFSLDDATLLGAIRHGGFVPWSEKFSIMITIEGLNKLRRLYPNNLIDSFVDEKYDELSVSWVRNNKKWKEDQPFVSMRVLIPTTLEELKKYSLKSKTRFLKFKKENIKKIIDSLFVRSLNNAQGYALLDYRKINFKNNWLELKPENSDLKTKEISFLDTTFPIVDQYETLLIKWFGKDFEKASVPSTWFTYPYPTKKIKVIGNENL